MGIVCACDVSYTATVTDAVLATHGGIVRGVLFFFSFLILCEFHVMHSIPIHLSDSSYPPSALVTCPQKENKQINKQTKYCHCGSSSASVDPFVHTSLLGLVLSHHQYWILSGTPLGYSVVALCHGDPPALDLQD